MVKERKPQTGSTNLDSSRYYELPITSQDTLTRSITHKIIVPDPPAPLPYEYKRRLREVPKLATWKAANPLKSDFNTTHETSYTDPASRAVEPGFESSFSSLKAEEMRHLAQNAAIDKLNRVAKNRFGGISNLFKAFKKFTGDSISLRELNDNIRKRNLEFEFPPDDQRTVFDIFDKKNEGVISVGALLKEVEKNELENTDSVAKRDMLAARAFLAEQLEQARKEKQERAAVAGGGAGGGGGGGVIDGLQDQLKLAIGQKSFDLDVTAEEMNEIAENTYKNRLTHESTERFARFLRMTNVNLDYVPFYDRRSEGLERRKFRGELIEGTLNSQALGGRLKELKGIIDEEQRQRAVHPCLLPSQSLTSLKVKSGGLSQLEGLHTSFDNPDPSGVAFGVSPIVRGERKETFPSSGESSSMKKSASMPALPRRQTDGKKADGGGSGVGGVGVGVGVGVGGGGVAVHVDSGRAGWMDQPKIATSPVASERVPRYRNVAGAPDPEGPPGGQGGPAAAGGGGGAAAGVEAQARPFERNYSEPTLSPALNRSSSPRRDTGRGGGGGGGGYAAPEPPAGEYYSMDLGRNAADFIQEATRTRLPPSMLQGETMHQTGAKRFIPPPEQKLTTATLTRNYGDIAPDPYATTHDSYFPELLYKPSQPISRDLVSDADRDAQAREERRRKRYVRTKANMDVTAHRVEYMKLYKEDKDLRRAQTKNESTIRYEADVFLNDMKEFKKFPLMTMMKKPNFSASDTMWGGHLRSIGSSAEPHDFHTTYTASFDSKVLTTGPALVSSSVDTSAHGAHK